MTGTKETYIIEVVRPDGIPISYMQEYIKRTVEKTHELPPEHPLHKHFVENPVSVLLLHSPVANGLDGGKND